MIFGMRENHLVLPPISRLNYSTGLTLMFLYFSMCQIFLCDFIFSEIQKHLDQLKNFNF